MFVPKFKILGAVVPEKSLTKKNTHRQTDTYTDRLTHTHTHTDKHCYEKDKNYIPLRTSFAGGIKRSVWGVCLTPFA